MSTSEFDLRNNNVLLEVIRIGAAKRAQHGPQWDSLRLAGIGRTTLRDRVETDRPRDVLVWVIEVTFDRMEVDAGPLVLRYGMSSRELGDLATGRDRGELRLRKLAEAHLRAELELIRHGWPPRGPESVSMIDRRGWCSSD